MIPNKKETKLTINGPVGGLAAVLTPAEAQGALAAQPRLVIICHPHPAHGGTMDNKVVTTLLRIYRDLGVHVLRFNFRGVGESEGQFDDAVGEREDVMAVVRWAQLSFPKHRLLLAGFSFGSSIVARASYAIAGVEHMTLVAPPIERYEYDREGLFNCPVCVIQGDQDELVKAQGVYDWVDRLSSPVELIRYEDCGHYFHGYLSVLRTDLARVLLAQIKP
jgi:uncharacterized protein